MAEAGLTITGDGQWMLSGELDFDTVPSLLARRDAEFTSDADISVDLSKVTRVDSAGLALMVEWLREAERVGLAITFENVPEQLQSIARVCGLCDILSLSH